MSGKNDDDSPAITEELLGCCYNDHLTICKHHKISPDSYLAYVLCSVRDMEEYSAEANQARLNELIEIAINKNELHAASGGNLARAELFLNTIAELEKKAHKTAERIEIFRRHNMAHSTPQSSQSLSKLEKSVLNVNFAKSKLNSLLKELEPPRDSPPTRDNPQTKRSRSS